VQTGSLLSSERAVLQEHLGFDEAALRRLDATALEVAFLTDAERRQVAAALVH
jgi:adenosine deaminase